MKSVLISLVGRGRKEGNNKEGYSKALYKFEDGYSAKETAFFGSALYNYLRDKESKVDSWIVFGTGSSAWSEVIKSIDEDKLTDELLDLYSSVYSEEDDEISSDMLMKWQNALEEYFNGIHLVLANPRDYSTFINSLMELVPDSEEVNIIFDMTHAYRHMSVIVSFSLMYLRYFKRIKNVDVFYGALDMAEDGITPVLKIDFISQIFSMSTNFELFNSAGYFSGVLNELDIKNSESTYFKIEMNRNPRGELGSIIDKLTALEESEHTELYIKRTAENVKKEIYPLHNKKYLDERMMQRAVYFFDRNQYLKAIVLLYEAINILYGRKTRIGGGDTYEGRRAARERLKAEIRKSINQRSIVKDSWMGEIYRELEYTRNAAVHGSQARNHQDNVESYPKLKDLFENSIRLYNTINSNN